MDRVRLIALLAGVIAMAVPLHAGAIFQFDELGNIADSIAGGPFVQMPSGTLQFDPTGGVGKPAEVLEYDLTSVLNGKDLIAGDVPIGFSGGLIGDLRFTDPAGQMSDIEACGTGTGDVECLMIFYVFDNNGLAADVGNISTSFLTTQTPGTSLVQGSFSYSFSYEAGVLAYDGTIVPEPTPAVMLLCGLATFIYLRKRSKAA
jgi:hypothetical protein